MSENPFPRSELDVCPHSEMYTHKWHGLPTKGCGGSHLDKDEAKKLAKPFDASDEKYPSRRDLDSLNLNLSIWREILGPYSRG